MVKENHTCDEKQNDSLRGEFTSWLNTVLYRARLKYIKNTQHKLTTVSLNDLDMQQLVDPNDHYAKVEGQGSQFDFQEERLAQAFRELSLVRREVLRLLFVEELSPKEVAKQLNCSENYVHLQKSRALQKLRKHLQEEFGDDEW